MIPRILLHFRIFHRTNPGNLHVSNDSDDLDDSKDEFGFTIAFDTKHVDADDENKKDCDKNGMRILPLLIPEIDSDRSTNDFQR